MGHLRGLSGDAEESAVYARWVAPYYSDLMGPAAPLPKTRRAKFVRSASIAAYWIPTPMIRVLYGSTEWRARIAASFYAAVHGDAVLIPEAEAALDDKHMIHDLYMHHVALAVLDAPDRLLAEVRQQGPGGVAAAALRAGGPRCRAVARTASDDDGQALEPHDAEPPAQVAALVLNTRRAVAALRAKDKH